MKICAVLCVVVALALGSPVPLNTHSCLCSSSARSLLSSLTHIMEKEGIMEHQDLFAGFNCTDLEAQMIPYTQTSSVCQPSASDDVLSCSGQTSSSFSETECLRNIAGDLQYYEHLLSDYKSRDSGHLSPVKTATSELMQCLEANGVKRSAAGESPEKWVVWIGSSFEDRVSLCKTLKGFHVRAITMNRALGYIGSGDHRK